MSKIEITTSNIGGIKSRKDTVEMGKVNIVRGTSSSGKSSLLRGIHAAIVGQTPHEDKFIREVETLHLADRNSDQAILYRGSSEGKASVTYGGNESSISISRVKFLVKTALQKPFSLPCFQTYLLQNCIKQS